MIRRSLASGLLGLAAVLALVLLALYRHAASQGTLLTVYEDFARTQDELSRCVPPDNSSDRLIISCNTDALEKYYKLMNKVFELAMKEIPSVREREQLKRSQDKWMGDWVKECSSDPSYLANSGGTAYPGTLALVIYGLCKTDAYEKRIRQLLLMAH